MKLFNVKIEGVSPLLMNKFGINAEVQPTARKQKKDYGTPREQARKALYADDDGRIFIPSMWIKGALMTVSSDFKLPGSRKSVKSVAGGSILFPEEKIYFVEGYKGDQFEVDSRPCVVQRARILRSRPRFEKWSFAFVLEVDDSILDPSNVHEMLGDAGKRAGIGDYRPQKGGPFGRFLITQWSPIKSK